ncbi:hypothetical protein [Sinorhizobium fredii]|uniref:hypothetical protein n=1 Tax=Rhizobium fredii TaxID=380 RepID=UPI0018E941F3|nr:hypothetical protein [Sinorhizobium fredii]
MAAEARKHGSFFEDERTAGAEATQAGSRGAGQQDRPHRLEDVVTGENFENLLFSQT